MTTQTTRHSTSMVTRMVVFCLVYPPKHLLRPSAVRPPRPPVDATAPYRHQPSPSRCERRHNCLPKTSSEAIRGVVGVFGRGVLFLGWFCRAWPWPSPRHPTYCRGRTVFFHQCSSTGVILDLVERTFPRFDLRTEYRWYRSRRSVQKCLTPF